MDFPTRVTIPNVYQRKGKTIHSIKQVNYGSRQHLNYMAEQKKSNPSYELPEGFKWRPRLQVVQRLPELNRFISKLPRNVNRRDKVAVNQYGEHGVGIKRAMRELSPITVEKGRSLQTYGVYSASRPAGEFTFKAKEMALTLMALKHKMINSKMFPKTYKVTCRIVLSGGRIEHYDNNGMYHENISAGEIDDISSYEAVLDAIKRWETKFPSINIYDFEEDKMTITAIIKVTKIFDVGGCSTPKFKTSKLDLRKKNKGGVVIRLCSPYSTNDNCGLACVARFLGIHTNKFKPESIREKLNITEGCISREDMKRVCTAMRVNTEFYHHPIKDERDVTWKVTPNESEDSPLLRLHLIAGHYEYEHLERQVYVVCDKCGKGKGEQNGKPRGILVKPDGSYDCYCNNIVQRGYYMSRVQKRRVLKLKNKAEAKGLDLSKLVFYDFETKQRKWEKKSIVYAVGWIRGDQLAEGKVTTVYGRDAMKQFMDWAYEQEDMTFVSFNGSRFDSHIMVDYVFSNGLTWNRKKNILINNSRVLVFDFGGRLIEGDPKAKNKKEQEDRYIGCNHIWDLCLFTGGSLREVCKSFNCPVQKGDFDHEKIQDWDDVETYKEEYIPYLEKDVLGLAQATISFCEKYAEKIGINPMDRMTLGQTSFEAWSATDAKRVIEEKGMWIDFHYTREEYERVRSSIYGGRCYSGSPYFVSQAWNDVKDRFDMTPEEKFQYVTERMDYLKYVDVVSLYPSVMLGCKALPNPRYPVGEHRVSNNPEEDYRAGKLGIFHVKLTAPNNLSEPYIPRRKKGGCLEYSLEPVEGNYNNVDILNAERLGYKVEFFPEDWAIVWDNYTTTMFKDYITEMFEWKKEAKLTGDPVGYFIAKIGMNSLYGKCFQKPNMEETFYPKTDAEAQRLAVTHRTIDMILCKKSDQWIIKAVKHNAEEYEHVTKPCQLASFVTAYSRQLMLDMYLAYNPKMEKNYRYNTDTDSMVVPAWGFDMLRNKGLIGLDLGELEDELKGGIIVEAFFLAPKTYALKYVMPDGEVREDKIGCKGLSHRYNKAGEVVNPTGIAYEDFVNHMYKPNREMFSELPFFEGSVEREVTQSVFRKYGTGSSTAYYEIDDVTGEKLRCCEAFGISVYKANKVFMKSEWTGMILNPIDGMYYPRGYNLSLFSNE